MAKCIKLVRKAAGHHLTVDATGADWPALTAELMRVKFPASAERILIIVQWGKKPRLDEDVFLMWLTCRVLGRYSRIHLTFTRGDAHVQVEIPSRA